MPLRRRESSRAARASTGSSPGAFLRLTFTSNHVSQRSQHRSYTLEAPTHVRVGWRRVACDPNWSGPESRVSKMEYLPGIHAQRPSASTFNTFKYVVNRTPLSQPGRALRLVARPLKHVYGNWLFARLLLRPSTAARKGPAYEPNAKGGGCGRAAGTFTTSCAQTLRHISPS